MAERIVGGVEVRAVLAQDDAETLQREAHSIKGGAANICAMPLSLAAKQLEDISKSGDLAEAATGISNLVKTKEKMYAYFQETTSTWK